MGGRMNAFLLGLGTRQECLLSQPLLNIVLNVIASAIRHKKKIKGLQIGKEGVKLSLFTMIMIRYIENFKASSKHLLINKFNKLVEYKINV